MAGYNTKQGKCITGDSIEVLAGLKDSSTNMIITSPPFSNQRKKKYDNFDEIPQDEYVDWLLQFAKAAYSKLATNGSLVIDIALRYYSKKCAF